MTTETTSTKAEKGLSRRTLLKTGAAAVGAIAGSGAITGFPTIWAQTNITLRQFGTGVSNINAIAEKCKADLGITLEMTATDSDAAAQRAVTQPDSYDIADIEYWIAKKVFPTGVLQPMDVKKLKYYDKIVPLFINGKLKPESVIAQGTAPHTVGFVEAPGAKTFAKEPTQWMTMVPTIYNADTLGIRPDLVGRDISSWADIMDPKFKGKTSILNIPSIGIMDAAMIMEAMGNIKYADKGNMTKEEIDKTIEFLIKAKGDGQFRAFWKSFDESVNLMASGEVVIQSMWSPAVAAVRSKGIACKYQPLKEGYRAWGGRPRPCLAPQGRAARCGLRIYQLVHVGLGRRLPQPPGLLFRLHGNGQELHDSRRMGLLDRGQAGTGRYPVA
ncbi:putative spermidine/putrescine transport system substrate-binding protein [Rhizobium anhuiense]